MSEPPYRKKRKVLNISGEAHELTFSCFHNQKFLSKDRTRAYFINAVRSARLNHAFHLWAYVIMPDHVHLLVFPPQEKYDMRTIQKSIKQSVSRKAINYLRKDNPNGLRLLETGQKKEPYRFWQAGGGYDRNVIKFKTAAHMVNYIHNNPVRKGLVDEPGAWKWSSLREWQEACSGPLSLDLDSFPFR